MWLAVRAALLLAVVAGCGWIAHARTRAVQTVWVFFDEDAAANPDAPPAIGPEAARHRSALGLGTLSSDRPVPAHLIEQVRETGASVRVVSRWLRAVSVDADRRTIARLTRITGVKSIRPVGRFERVAADVEPTADTRPPTPDSRASTQSFDSLFYGANWHAIRELNVMPVHVLGFNGADVTVALLDTGFETRHANLTTRQIVATRDFINGDVEVFDEPGEQGSADQDGHGTRVFSILGGYTPGVVVGPAYGARFLLAKVDAEPGDTGADEDRWVAALEWADSAGARVVNSSLVYRFSFTDRADYPYSAMDGDQTPTTRAADEAARRGLLIVNAIGNNGPATGTLEAPADADSVIAVGAVDASGEPASFGLGASARGPSFDGRTKPEVVARGVGLTAASSENLTAIASSLSGTSFAAPLIAGSAATFVQAWPNLNPLAVRRAFQLAGNNAAQPDNNVGWGVPDVAAAILFPQGITASGIATTDPQANLTTLAPTFTWSAPLVHPQMRPVTYHVEIATDSTFQNIVRTDTVRDASSLQLRRALRPAERLFWRVVARTPLGVTYTSPRGARFGMPAWVRLISPAGTSVTFIEDPRPELSWATLVAPPPVGPLVFDVEVIQNSNNVVVQRMSGLSTSSVRVAQPLNYNVSYRWRVIARTQSGMADTVASAAPFVVTSTGQPPATLLYQNFPNPFPRPDLGEGVTHIWFDLAEPSAVELSVHDLTGRLVRRLIPAPGCGPVTLEPGLYGRGGEADPCILTTWDGGDADGVRVPAGIYIIRLEAAGEVQYRRALFRPR